MHKAGCLRSEYRSVEIELEILSMINSKRAQTRLDEIEMRGAALLLASLYNGMERILVTILTDRKETLQRDEKWHVKLIQKSSITRHKWELFGRRKWLERQTGELNVIPQ